MKRWYDGALAAAIPVFAAAALLWAGGLYASQTEPFKREVVYKTVGPTKLRLFIFEPNDSSRDIPSSAIVFFFGGGWTHGEPNQFFPQCRYFASRGMVAISAEYRVKSRNGTGPVKCVKDGKSAVRWVRANAGNLDEPRVKAHLLKTFPRLGDAVAQISPSQHVRPNLPPTIIFHGTNDRIVAQCNN